MPSLKHASSAALTAALVVGCATGGIDHRVMEGELGTDGGTVGTVGGSAGTIGDTIFGTAGDEQAGVGGGSVPVGPEVCDGYDNDQNGIVDDVDKNGDGICDCLNVATVGQNALTGQNSTYTSSVFDNWLKQRSTTAATALGDQIITDDLLRPYQVLVFMYVGTYEVDLGGVIKPANHVYSSEEAAAFMRWVDAGGGVVTTAGYLPDEGKEVENINRLLATAGLGYSQTKTELNGMVESWVNHPVTQGIIRIRTSNGVEPDGSGGTTLGREMLTVGQPHVALQVGTSGDGHIVVWGDEWILYDSLWQNESNQQIPRFWANVLKWVTKSNMCQVSIPAVVK